MKYVALLLTLFPTVSYAQDSSWSPPPAIELVNLISSQPGIAAKKIRESWGEKSLRDGRNKWIEETTVLWAVISDQPVAVVDKSTGHKIGDLVKLDQQGLQAMAKTFPNATAFDYVLKTASGETVGQPANIKIETYPHEAESLTQPDVPKGAITRHRWNASEIFPDTQREYQVYIPAQYDGSKPAALMVFQDGLRHADPNRKGGLRTTVVFDNLIAAGKMPITIGLFVNPGSKPSKNPNAKPSNRSFEYDSLGDLYVRFLLDELIPHVVKEHNLKLSDDPGMWAIAGGSSACACAWTAAWERPDRFGKVLGWVGTFVDIRGANAYPSLIRKTERKPIRAAFLEEGQDLDNKYGNWPLANRQMEAALKFSKYDYKYWWGNGFHGSRHAAAMLPEMLTWLWAK